jgi:hypothetical protein
MPTLVVDDKERVIQQIERNDGIEPHAVTLAGAEQHKRDGPAKTELPADSIENDSSALSGVTQRNGNSDALACPGSP